MTAPDLVNLSGLMDDAKCFAFVRQHRWPEGVRCPDCDGAAVIRDGCDDTQRSRQRYRCKACTGRFDDLTGTIRAVQRSGMRRRLRRRSRPPMAARKRSWESELRRFDLRMLKAKLRSLAKTPGLMRMRERSSPMVTSRL